LKKSAATIGETMRPIIVTLVVLGLTGFNVLFSIKAVALDFDFYLGNWVELDIPKSAQMSLDDLKQVGWKLIAYFTGNESTPQLTLTVDGIQRPLYRENEITHLEDVRALFQLGFLLKHVCEVLVLLGILLSVLVCKYVPGGKCTVNGKSSKTGKQSSGHLLNTVKSITGKSFKTAGVILTIATILLALPAAFDFTGWWTGFHLLTFQNDLWRLDPDLDWLIKIFPEEFFLSAAKRTALYSLSLSAIYFALGIVLGLSVNHFSSDHCKNCF
jgi:uncharacterized membrane protein